MPTRTDKYELFKERDCLSLNEIKEYTAKHMDGELLHKVESHMASCELCNDAVEGYMAVPAFDLSSQLGRKGRGSPNWTNTATRLIIGAGVLLGVYYLADRFQQAPSVVETEQEIDEGLVLYDPEKELEQLNTELAEATELPKTQQVGHSSNALIAQPASNELVVPKTQEDLPLVRDTSGIAVNMDAQPTTADAIGIKPPRPVLQRLPVSKRQLMFINDLKLVHPDELYTMIDPNKAIGGTNAATGINQDEGIVRQEQYSYTQVLETATDAFVREQHKEAAQQFNLWLNKHPKDVNCLFYLGLCYYNLGLYERALAHFGRVRDHSIDTFKEEATWYHALSNEQVNGFDASKGTYEKIALLGGFYSDRAQAKLER